ncbi:MAG: DEAD/DEAH box helicase, partial [Myxococcaceae bacterium]
MPASQTQLIFAPPAPVDPSLDTALAAFHPVVQRWFQRRLGEPSEPQRQGWPLIRDGRDVLIAAPTGSGKTLAAFLACIDQLFRRALKGTLEDKTRIVYVSPLKALGNDVQKNLLGPLKEILELARQEGHDPQEIRVGVRSGDTTASERAAMVKRPPHILITTPESLYLYLTARAARETLRGAETVIVDEIHALARDKRGSHFTLSMQRMKALCKVRPQFVGLSATQKPLEKIAAFLTGGAPCSLVQVGHLRPWEISIELPDEEVSGVPTHEMWGQVYERLIALTEVHRTILVFTNTRKLSERIAHDLGERIGQEKVAAHHGSMSKELRLRAEEKLKAGELRVMVATASLELGIDIGAVDLVVQIGTPRSIAVALQRVGRAGHYKGGISRGLFFALTRDDLVECTALLRAIKEGELDAVVMPEKPLDVLAQQIVAHCACEDQDEDAVFELMRGAHPYRDLTRAEFDKVVEMLSEGISTKRGRARVHIHRDRVNGKLRARKGARLTALTNGGAIPDTFTYPVIAEPEGKQVGTLDEDFAVESMAGDVFVLGSTSWRIHRVIEGTVRVEDAKGAPPSVPFWRGEAPARTDELSVQVGRLREDIARRADAHSWLETELGLSPAAADLLVRYVRTSAAILGGVPSRQTIIAERFFDEAGGMQLVIHSPYGGRINRAWGLALRKNFCRTFDFELQAAASDDGILLSLGEQHSFPLKEIFDYVTPDKLEEVLEQAVLQIPLFGTRFRWNATRALALQRQNGGKRVPPQIQRSRSDDLLAAVFPAQLGCQDNHMGADVELPDHPLVDETMANCLHEAMDLDGLRELINGIRSGSVKTLAVDVPEPSPLSHQIVNSAPYTYLDDAPLEERRARMVSLRRTLPAEDQIAFGALDGAAISQVVRDAQPVIRDGDELHDALLALVMMPDEDVHPDHYRSLEQQGRVTRFTVDRISASSAPASFTFQFKPVAAEKLAAWKLESVVAPPLSIENRPTGAPPPAEPVTLLAPRKFVVSAERMNHARAIFPEAKFERELPPIEGDPARTSDEALLFALRGWMEIWGPVTVRELAAKMAVAPGLIDIAMHALENEGAVLRGTFRPDSDGTVEWCDRRLLQRIHRITVGRLRAEIEPLATADLMRFLFRWHHLDTDDRLRGRGGLYKAISLLAGYEAPASAWEKWLLPSRMAQYLPELLEHACFSGEVAWGRLTERDAPKPAVPLKRGAANVQQEAETAAAEETHRRVVLTRNAPLTFFKREDMDWLLGCARPEAVLADGGFRLPEGLSAVAKEVAEVLERRGACFFRDLVAQTRRLPAEVEDALWELLAHGVVTADAVDNL